MNAHQKQPLPTTPMTADEYLVWAQAHPGKYELHNGYIVSKSPQRSEHAEIKYAVQRELDRAIKAAGVPCRMLPDGMTVRVAKKMAFEPDALVYCGPKVPTGTVEIANPIIVVEVLSPSTDKYDATAKLAHYFNVPSIAFYLIVNPLELPAVLHSRHTDGTILTRLLHSGTIKLDPPGIEIDIPALFAND